jgi:hypothetical protein
LTLTRPVTVDPPYLSEASLVCVASCYGACQGNANVADGLDSATQVTIYTAPGLIEGTRRYR